MAKWSVVIHGSAIDSAENDPYRIDGLSDTENLPLEEERLDDSKIKYIDGLRSLFYKVLVAFLKDIAGRVFLHPILAKMGDGQFVDLFELFIMVRRRGGYEVVSQSCEWGLVNEELGFNQCSIPSLKLMHFKYLYEFDIWLRNRCGNIVEDEKWENDLDDFGLLFLELEIGVKAFANDVLPGTNIQSCVLHYDNETKINHHFNISHWEADSLTIPTLQSSDMEDRKRKRESLQGMLSWIIDVAKYPDDVGIVLEQSKLRKQALMARESLFLQRTRRCSSGIREAPQATKRMKESKDHCACPITKFVHCDGPSPKHKPIGPLFQAEVPKWTGIICKSDPKWLGTKVLPLQNDIESLGRGRESVCACPHPSSVECIKFHIAEKRLKLKLQLGYSLFYDWRFNCMGEEVAIQWTPEEETRFKKIMGSSVGEHRWGSLFKHFPNKTRKDLVNYYFNVFILRHRCYQNHVTPKDIDSDGEDSDFGSFGDCLDRDRAQMLDYLPCSLNEQCTKWEN
ncbi:hypothetical protein SAY87_029562 [Trapa incisa]|uniref:ARID domain-containing protein n=1 Tax=Trapa incisa TaxID=236973 RepID=A0AAN7KBW6_9MYRT|nr:hypothetical protein SAY87_029562 [Trapa incisa]